MDVQYQRCTMKTRAARLVRPATCCRHSATMLRDVVTFVVVVERKRPRYMPLPMLTTWKEVAWFSFSMNACGSVPVAMVFRLGTRPSSIHFNVHTFKNNTGFVTSASSWIEQQTINNLSIDIPDFNVRATEFETYQKTVVLVHSSL